MNPAEYLQETAELMRSQHGPEHVRHEFWSRLADWLDYTADFWRQSPAPDFSWGDQDAALAAARAYRREATP